MFEWPGKEVSRPTQVVSKASATHSGPILKRDNENNSLKINYKILILNKCYLDMLDCL